MANVKMNNKKRLDKLQAELTLRLGKKVTQQEILDRSIDFTYKWLDKFIYEEISQPILTREIISSIKKNSIDAPLAHPDKSDDELMYGL